METQVPGEIVAIDIMKVGLKNILVAINYYSRKIWCGILQERNSKMIKEFITNKFRTLRIKKLISDNAKEFTSREFKTFLSEKGIHHHLTSLETHQSNGRCERVIRTLRDAIVKSGKEITKEMLREIIIKYNNTRHSGIKTTPDIAFHESPEICKIENSKMGNYPKKFNKGKTAINVFKKNQKVLVAKNENLGNLQKSNMKRFTRNGIILEIGENNTYLVRLVDTGKIEKRIYTYINAV